MATGLDRPAHAPSDAGPAPAQPSPEARRPQAVTDPELEHFLRLVTAQIIAECTARWRREVR